MRTKEEIDRDAEPDRRVFSNSTQYEIWAASGKGCYDCKHDDPDREIYCPILGVALMGHWPAEWPQEEHHWSFEPNPATGYEGGSGTFLEPGECTAFEERDDWPGDPEEPDGNPPPDPAVEVAGQLDIFGVYAGQITKGLPTGEPASTR